MIHTTLNLPPRFVELLEETCNIFGVEEIKVSATDFQTITSMARLENFSRVSNYPAVAINSKSKPPELVAEKTFFDYDEVHVAGELDHEFSHVEYMRRGYQDVLNEAVPLLGELTTSMKDAELLAEFLRSLKELSAEQIALEKGLRDRLFATRSRQLNQYAKLVEEREIKPYTLLEPSLIAITNFYIWAPFYQFQYLPEAEHLKKMATSVVPYLFPLVKDSYDKIGEIIVSVKNPPTVKKLKRATLDFWKIYAALI